VPVVAHAVMASTRQDNPEMPLHQWSSCHRKVPGLRSTGPLTSVKSQGHRKTPAISVVRGSFALEGGYLRRPNSQRATEPLDVALTDQTCHQVPSHWGECQRTD
jgi:hypothetical protein